MVQLLPCAINSATDVQSGDALVLVVAGKTQIPDNAKQAVDQFEKVNSSLWSSAVVHVLPVTTDEREGNFVKEVNSSLWSSAAVHVLPVTTDVHKSGRLILSTTGPIHRDYDDVRSYKVSAENAINSAVSSGSKSPLLVIPKCERFVEAPLITALGALQGLYIPLETREAKPAEQQKVKEIHIFAPNLADAAGFVNTVIGIEKGRTVHRDIGGSDPERMAPPKVADYVLQAFANSKSIKVEVLDDQSVIKKEYPLMAAVNRCANTVPRHQARLIKLTYEGHGDINETLMLVGKGVTLDTGGADLKVQGIMYGMSRDKLGATTIAGFMKSLEELQPAGLKVVAFMCMVRNSIGSEAYTCDEIITARNGTRIRIVNTDAEGRLTMLDPLCHMKEMALKEKNAHIYTLATLTGHAHIAFGNYFSAVMDNGPATAVQNAEHLHQAGVPLGDYVEISRLRKEDYDWNLVDTGVYNDIRQCNTGSSSSTARGHQAPAAFLIQASGIVDHGTDSKQPLKYTHIDMASSEGDMDVPYGRPLLAFINRYILKRVKNL